MTNEDLKHIKERMKENREKVVEYMKKLKDAKNSEK